MKERKCQFAEIGLYQIFVLRKYLQMELCFFYITSEVTLNLLMFVRPIFYEYQNKNHNIIRVVWGNSGHGVIPVSTLPTFLKLIFSHVLIIWETTCQKVICSE